MTRGKAGHSMLRGGKLAGTTAGSPVAGSAVNDLARQRKRSSSALRGAGALDRPPGRGGRMATWLTTTQAHDDRSRCPGVGSAGLVTLLTGPADDKLNPAAPGPAPPVYL